MVCSSKVATGLLYHDVPKDRSLITVMGGGRGYKMGAGGGEGGGSK